VRLLRLIVANYEPPVPDWTKFRGDMDGVNFGTIAALPADGRTRLAMCADTSVRMPLAVGPDGLVEVPEQPRRLLEASLEKAVDLVSLSTASRRWIWSPDPCVFLLPDSSDDTSWLGDKIGLGNAQSGTASVHTDCRFPIDGDIPGAIRDRWDGVALLADALASSDPMGRFRELARFFERAFAKSSSALVEPLCQFLASTSAGLSAEEVSRWATDLRHASVHADRKPFVARPKDVAFVAPRMMAAGYDVLLNKLNWHKPDTARRELWRAPMGSSDAGSGVFITQGKGGRLGFILFDQFRVYPLDLGVHFRRPPIQGAWPAAEPGSASASES